MSRESAGVIVSDLIAAGLIRAPTAAWANFEGKVLRVQITQEGKFELDGVVYDSPSTAGGHAITKASSRRTSGRKYFSVNGWTLWRVRDSNGEERSLSEVRDQLTGRASDDR